jgi:hypothetical protein
VGNTGFRLGILVLVRAYRTLALDVTPEHAKASCEPLSPVWLPRFLNRLNWFLASELSKMLTRRTGWPTILEGELVLSPVASFAL